MPPPRPGYAFTKRLIDFVAAAAGLIMLAPFGLILAVVVVWRLGWPVFFSQERPGRDGVPFRMVKFRSMSQATDAGGRLLPDEQRLTAFGRWLRSTSLDELPELWNVLRGEMSLVGPRPLMTEYLPLYSPRQAQRHAVRPGITGWAQINGRNASSWEERLEHDVWYVENRSLALDLRILLLTLGRIFRREGIAAEGHATMPPFRGSGVDPKPKSSDADPS